MGIGAAERKVLRTIRSKYEAAMGGERPNPHVIKRWRYHYWQATGLAKAGVPAAELISSFGGGEGMIWRDFDSPVSEAADESHSHPHCPGSCLKPEAN